MIALGVRYLTGYAVATNLARERPEWPPHPGRVFMAMAAAHFETGAAPEERAALEWLEEATPPALRASGADERTPVRAYVPVNDVHNGIFARPRQERAFPRVRPHEDTVYLIWGEEPPAETRAALDRLCAKVTRVGHSMSAVEMWVVPRGQEPAPNWLPAGSQAETYLRVATDRTLESLEAAFNGEAIEAYDALTSAIEAARGREKARRKTERESRFPGGRPESRCPQLARWHGYAKAAGDGSGDAVFEGPFGENFVVLAKTEGAALGLESTLQLTGALRNAAMKAAGDALPEWLSGHDAAGAPSLRPHVAFFPLPYVGFPHADGHILGLGMAIPRRLELTCGETEDEELRRVLGPLFFDPETGEERMVELWKEGAWRWSLERETRERPPVSLRRRSWTQPSRAWASVTPVVLHHYPKKREGDIERIVTEAFASAGFPRPETVAVRGVSAVEGAGHAMAVPPYTEGGPGLCGFRTHVVVRFAQAVRGPLLAGRGRFRGYGLFRPLGEEEALPWMS